MSAELSRRFGRVAYLEPLCSLPVLEHQDLDRLTYQLSSFEDLPERYQQVILAAEAIRERLLADQQASVSA